MPERMSSGEACKSLLEALNAQRTDILKSLLDHLVSGQAEGVTVAEVLPPSAFKYSKHFAAGFSQPVLPGRKPSAQGSGNGSERCSESSPSCRSRSRSQKSKWRDVNAGGALLYPVVFLSYLDGWTPNLPNVQ